MDALFDAAFAKSSLKALLRHLGTIEDPRDPRRIMYPLCEILFLVVCGTICDCDDYESIALWGKSRLSFLRRYLPFDNGLPGGRWLTIFMNRIDPGLFEAAFLGWVAQTWPDKLGLVAIDGKTSRGSHDRSAGKPPLHLLTAYATTLKLVLAQKEVAAKSCEIAAIPSLIAMLAEKNRLAGALISIDAIATTPAIAAAILAAKADYLLAVKDNRPTLREAIETFFDDPASEGIASAAHMDKGHGRIEERTVWAAQNAAWLYSDRHYPGELGLPGIKTIIRIRNRTELKDRCRTETRLFISSRPLSPEQALEAIRSHWAIENSHHWVLDVTFRDDQSRLRKGHGALNMAIVRHFSINLVRTLHDKRSVRLRRKAAGWDTEYLAQILGEPIR
jgi:predicted transposase YbfD/YdcC